MCLSERMHVTTSLLEFFFFVVYTPDAPIAFGDRFIIPLLIARPFKHLLEHAMVKS